jgi:branched-chain amino acid transport system substrate-binding protein
MSAAHERDDSSLSKSSLSRRDFLKVAGISGATIGAGGALGGLVAACGGGEATTTTTTAAPTTTAPPATTATTVAPATTTTAGVEQGRAVKLGVTMPKTGIYAAFAEPMEFLIDQFKTATKDGVVLGDGQTHAIEVVVADTQSDSARAAQVAGDLISNSKVDLMYSQGSPDNVLPVADQCEALGTPSLSLNCPWEPFVFGRKGAIDKPFKWTFLACPGVAEFVAADTVTLGLLPTNKKAGLLFANTADGQAWSDKNTGYPAALAATGYTVVMPDLYPAGLEDFTSQISQFKKEGCDICLGTPSVPELTNFWKQSLQQNYHPTILLMGLPLLFPAAPNAIGPTIYNATCELTWHPSWPFKSTLTGQTGQELVDAYEKASGLQWSMVLGSLHGGFEWTLDVLKRTTNVDDKEAYAKAAAGTKAEFIFGPYDFTGPVDTGPGEIHPTPNVACFACASGQWIKGEKWPFEVVQVGTYVPKLEPATTNKMQPMQYS